MMGNIVIQLFSWVLRRVVKPLKIVKLIRKQVTLWPCSSNLLDFFPQMSVMFMNIFF